MAEPNKKSKIGYGDIGRIGEVIQSGLLDEYDIVFTKDTHEIVFIDPNKNKLKMQARISYDTEEDALAEGYKGKIVTILTDGEYKPYIIQMNAEEFILKPLVKETPVRKTEPYATSSGVVFACGVPIIISADSENPEQNDISWYSNDAKIKHLKVPAGMDVYGGSEESNTEHEVIYPSASIQMNSGKITNIFGGGNGACSVGTTTVVVNGGTLASVSGGGCTGLTKDNHVGLAHVVINHVEGKPQVFGGSGEGYATTAESLVEINDGTYSYVTLGGSNGYTNRGKVIVNGGTIDVLQGGNRGQMSDVEFEVHGGTITHLYAVGEGGNSNPEDDPVIQNIKLKLMGGSITTLDIGEDKTKVSCVYVSGVVTNEDEVLADLPDSTETIPTDHIKEYLESALSIVEF